MTNTTRIYNIHLVNGQVLSTPLCPIMADQNLQPLAYFHVPVAIQRNDNVYDLSNRFQNLRVNQQNVLFVDETIAKDDNEALMFEQLFKIETIDLQSC